MLYSVCTNNFYSVFKCTFSCVSSVHFRSTINAKQPHVLNTADLDFMEPVLSHNSSLVGQRQNSSVYSRSSSAASTSLNIIQEFKPHTFKDKESKTSSVITVRQKRNASVLGNEESLSKPVSKRMRGKHSSPGDLISNRNNSPQQIEELFSGHNGLVNIFTPEPKPVSSMKSGSSKRKATTSAVVKKSVSKTLRLRTPKSNVSSPRLKKIVGEDQERTSTSSRKVPAKRKMASSNTIPQKETKLVQSPKQTSASKLRSGKKLAKKRLSDDFHNKHDEHFEVSLTKHPVVTKSRPKVNKTPVSSVRMSPIKKENSAKATPKKSSLINSAKKKSSSTKRSNAVKKSAEKLTKKSLLKDNILDGSYTELIEKVSKRQKAKPAIQKGERETSGSSTPFGMTKNHSAPRIFITPNNTGKEVQHLQTPSSTHKRVTLLSLPSTKYEKHSKANTVFTAVKHSVSTSPLRGPVQTVALEGKLSEETQRQNLETAQMISHIISPRLPESSCSHSQIHTAQKTVQYVEHSRGSESESFCGFVREKEKKPFSETVFETEIFDDDFSSVKDSVDLAEGTSTYSTRCSIL